MNDPSFWAASLANMPGIRTLFPYLPFILMWTIFWKGLALWHSGRRGQVVWFTALLIINTLGILEIIYLFAVCRVKLSALFSKKVGAGTEPTQ